jgi:hypothetical protein
MNTDYFVVVYDFISQEPLIKEIKRFRTEEKLWEYLQENKDSKISIYKGTCILDWS